jgi:hypothetical protein
VRSGGSSKTPHQEDFVRLFMLRQGSLYTVLAAPSITLEVIPKPTFKADFKGFLKFRDDFYSSLLERRGNCFAAARATGILCEVSSTL